MNVVICFRIRASASSPCLLSLASCSDVKYQLKDMTQGAMERGRGQREENEAQRGRPCVAYTRPRGDSGSTNEENKYKESAVASRKAAELRKVVRLNRFTFSEPKGVVLSSEHYTAIIRTDRCCSVDSE